MDVTWGEDHDALADVARAVLDRYSPWTDRDPAVDPAAQIRQFAELDWLALSDPRSTHADGAAELGSIAAIFVESGRALVESPLLAMTTARDLLLLTGSEAAVETAGRIGDGSRSVVAVLPDPAWRDVSPALGNGGLTGTVLAVPYAERADAFVVLGQESGEAVLAVVEAGAGAGIDIEPQPNLGEYPIASVTFSGVDSTVLARGTDAERAAVLARRRADVLLAAQVYGAGTRLLDISVEYAKQRHQFGGPIGRFQAVQYLCTDIAVAIHLTSLLARDAAAALDRGEDAALQVALLRKQAARTAQEMVHRAHEVHAGMGFMIESDVHLFTKAARAWQFALGTEADNDRTATLALDALYGGTQQ